MKYTQENKEKMYKWREENKDLYRKIVREGTKRYYDNNVVKESLRHKKAYRFKVECVRLRNIDIF